MTAPTVAEAVTVWVKVNILFFLEISLSLRHKRIVYCLWNSY